MPEAPQHTLSRRTVLTGGAALTAVGFVNTPAPATAAGLGKGLPTARVTVLSATDLHGNVLNWDYFKNAEFTNAKAGDIGLAKASTLDAGDTLQGHAAGVLRPDRPDHRRLRPPQWPAR